MFGRLFRRKSPKQEANPADLAEDVLAPLGFKLRPYGVGVVIATTVSGYSVHEAVSLVALVTLAREADEADHDPIRLMGLMMFGSLVTRELAAIAKKGLIRPEVWRHDLEALLGVCQVDAQQEKWIKKVLSDPIAGKERLADVTINYAAPETTQVGGSQ
jgi:hypothetical protein